MRILAVDDDPMILQLLRTSLSGSGFGDVAYAESAEEARALIDAAREPFDTFLLDIMLPGTCGIEMCREIRQIPAYRTTPIIMITASRAHDTMARAFEAGATDFVTKPFDGLELGTRINLAGMLNESLMRERMSQHKLEELTKLTTITFDERFDLRAGPGIKPFLTMENELLRRADDSLYAMTILSIQIENALQLFRAGTPAQFRVAVETVGTVLSETLDIEKTRFAYAGRGSFVAIVYCRQRIDTDAVELQANAALPAAWKAEAAALDPEAPDLRVEMIGDRRLWTGRSAAAAIREHGGRADILHPAEPEEVLNLFQRLSKKISSD
ncbi:response regulator [Sulfitobacter sp. HNIBRBA3233]|uniref:response regulator n=1 Tax=Sulfitobacter marinivivus TaxID=3158558 RepID=UPI0032DEC7B5